MLPTRVCPRLLVAILLVVVDDLQKALDVVYQFEAVLRSSHF